MVAGTNRGLQLRRRHAQVESLTDLDAFSYRLRNGGRCFERRLVIFKPTVAMHLGLINTQREPIAQTLCTKFCLPLSQVTLCHRFPHAF